jgi:catecholate siderophore receptor
MGSVGAVAQTGSTLKEVKIQASKDEKDFNPGVSSIGGKGETALRDIPQTVLVINRTVMDAQGSNTLAEALRNVPGLTISAGEGGAIGDNISLRGFSARTDIYLDGFRDRGQYSRDIFSLDEVEVLKGPSSMLFGRGSTGGVVNQVSKKAKKGDASQVGLQLGTQSHQRADVDINRQFSETGAFRVAAMVQDSDSTRDVVNVKRTGVASSLKLGMGTPTEITLSALVQQGREVPDYGVPFVRNGSNTVGALRTPIAAAANSYYGYADDYYDQDVLVLSAGVEHKLTADIKIKSRVQMTDNTTKVSASPPGAPSVVSGSPTGTLALQGTSLSLLQSVRGENNRHLRDKSLFNQTDLVAKIKAGGVTHNITTGVELGKDTTDNTAFDWTVATTASVANNLANPALGNRAGTPYIVSNTQTEATTFAVYANDQIDIGSDFKVVGGLRWDRFKSSSTARTLLNTTAPLTTTLDAGADRMLSTRAGAIWQPSSTQSYYLSYGTSFNPTAEAVTVSSANVDLDPEKNTSYELGGKWDLMDSRLALNAAIFSVTKDNARTPDPLNTGVNLLAGKLRVRGLELGAVGLLAPGLQIFSGYTYQDGKVLKSTTVGTGLDLGLTQTGKMLQNVPKHHLTVWLTQELGGGWDIGGGLVHATKRYLNNFETAAVPGYTRLDASVGYKQKAYDLRLNLTNLADKLFYETASASRAIPANGRQLKLTANYRF